MTNAEPSVHLTYPDLVERLFNPEIVALLPAPGELGAEFTSYDRASRYDAATGYYINWGANEDQVGCLRMEGDNAVLAEMTGPGCIWRIWSAAPKDGHVRIYLDGNPKPAVDLPFIGYFDGESAPFNHPELVYIAARGYNNYTPISYQKSCKIVALPGWGSFYHFNYTTFPPGTVVPTFKRELAPSDKAALEKAGAALSQRGKPPVSYAGLQTISKTVSAQPGETSEVAAIDGSRAIVGLRVKVKGLPDSPDARAVLLRELCLQITWDDDAKPSVWAPLGDFFGVAPGSNHFQSLMSGFASDGELYSYWYMPFARKARVELVNQSGAPWQVEFEISHAALSHPLETYGRFHAKWHRDAFLNEDLSRTIDWPLLKTKGRGRYVGTQLHIWNPRPGWWGEGDEKFFVDGEKFPSSFGTGSEDYFGYAWCDWHLFDQALHGQSGAVEGNTGNTADHRWQLADNVPFQKSFDGSIEKYFSNRRPTLYAATAYWYLSPDGVDSYEPVPVRERDAYWKDSSTALAPEGSGVIDADSMEARRHTGGRLGVRVTAEYAAKLGLSADRPLCLWVENKPGDTLELKVHSMWYVPKPGRFRLMAHCVKARGMGIVQTYWNGEKVGGPVDFYSAKVEEAEIDLGVHDVVPKIQLLKFEIIGSNPAAQPLRGFALDSILLAPEK